MPPNQVPDGDRRARQAARLANVLKVLELIQGRGRYGVKELAGELEISGRTLHRYLAILRLAGVAYYYDRNTKSLQIRPGFRFPTLNLTDDELIGQATAEALTLATGLDVNQGAGPTTRKLRATSKDQAASLLAKVERVTRVLDLKLADHSQHQELIRTIQWALIQSRRLSGMYASPYQPSSKNLELHPFRLCLIKQAWYLVARPTNSDEPHAYRVARFKSLRQIDSPTMVPDDFDLKTYLGNAWGVYRGDKTFDVEILFAQAVAKIVTETVWHHTQTVQNHEDGSVTLRFRVDGLNEISRWILGWAGWATILQPEELRVKLVEELRKALTMNGS